MIKLGSYVKDNITGFEGVAIARLHHLYGCVHIYVQPRELKEDGSPKPEMFFDEQRIEFIKDLPFVVENRFPSIQLGSKVADKTTGFKGIACAYMVHLFGNDRVCIDDIKLGKDGEVSKQLWVDLPGVEVIENAAPPVSEHATKEKQTGSMHLTDHRIQAPPKTRR